MKPIEHAVLKAFANQDRLNQRLSAEWKTAGYDYLRAIWTEVGETIMHTNWTWWKKGSERGKPLTDAQRSEVQIELCDIFHFGLSADLIKVSQNCYPIEQRVQDYMDAFEEAGYTKCVLDHSLEALVVDAILVRDFNIKHFARACRAVGLTLLGLMAFYYAKTALNEFRWENGYNLPKGHPDAYVKMWKLPDREPQEDNTYLIEIMEALIGGTGQHELAVEIETGNYGRSIRNHLADYYDNMRQR